MHLGSLERERNVVPRWREYRRTAASGELDPVEESKHGSVGEDEFQDAMRRWRASGRIADAVRACETAVVLGKIEDAQEPAEQIAKYRGLRFASVADLVASVKGADEWEVRPNTLGVGAGAIEEARQRVSELRETLKRDPRNAVERVNLARAYTILGVADKAQRQMDMALYLARRNRFVVRSAARLFVHVGKAEEAHELVHNTQGAESDPWLVAAELGVAGAAERSPRGRRRGFELLERNKLNGFAITELQSALGTIQYRSGKLRRARQLFRGSLSHPNDNSVAQAEWVSRRIGGLKLNEKHLETPMSYEARALSAHYRGAWETAVAECRRWLLDEPFSTRPATLGSFILGVVREDYDSAVEFARQGVIANPDNQLLRNNLVFSLVKAGRTEEAIEEWNAIDLEKASKSQRVALTATEGLLKFETGNEGRGRQLYKKALTIAESEPSLSSVGHKKALAALYWATEEKKGRSGDWREVLKLAEEAFESLSDKSFLHFLPKKFRGVRRRKD